MQITLELVRDQWQACYPAERLAKLYDRPMSPREVLTRKDGEWAGVSDKDRLWTVLRKDALPTRVLQSTAIFAGECALLNERQCGREPDARSWAAIEAARKFLRGEITQEEMDVASNAAYAAYAYAASNAASYASYAAAYASNAASYASYAAAYAAANAYAANPASNAAAYAAYAASNAAAIVNHVIAELDAMAPVAEPEATPTN